MPLFCPAADLMLPTKIPNVLSLRHLVLLWLTVLAGWQPPALAESSKIGAPLAVDRVRFFPAPDRENAMVGGKFTGSNVSPYEGFTLLAEIGTVPPPGEWSEIRFPNTTPYRWVRYEAPEGSRGNVAELEFFAGAEPLRAGGFGTAGSLKPGGHWKTAFDGKRETWFNSNYADGQYVGLDLGNLAAVRQPIITPDGGDWDQPQRVTMMSPTPGATIRYTLDGTTPGERDGQLYGAPFTIEKDTTIAAVAFHEGLAESPVSVSTIWIGKLARSGLNSFHVGNSLTVNASRFSTFIRTAGGQDSFPAYIIGGSVTKRLWDDSQGSDNARWLEAYSKAVHPLDYFTLQPRDFNVEEEVVHCLRFLDLVRVQSPDVQPWLYVEWGEVDRSRPTDKGQVPSFQMKQTFPAVSWEESMAAMLLYNEEVQHGIKASDRAGKPVRILPTAVALGRAHNLIQEGKFPGVAPGETNFFRTFFEDHVHFNMNGCYLVALTWYAALHGESPEGKLLPIRTTLTAEQARILQRLAWDVIKNYPDCGWYEAGSEPCMKPEIKNNGKIVTLSSGTSGSWFRYTLDGSTPTRGNGYLYCGVITVQPGIQVNAVAFKSGMADSAVAALTPGQIP